MSDRSHLLPEGVEGGDEGLQLREVGAEQCLQVHQDAETQGLCQAGQWLRLLALQPTLHAGLGRVHQLLRWREQREGADEGGQSARRDSEEGVSVKEEQQAHPLRVGGEGGGGARDGPLVTEGAEGWRNWFMKKMPRFCRKLNSGASDSFWKREIRSPMPGMTVEEEEGSSSSRAKLVVSPRAGPGTPSGLLVCAAWQWLQIGGEQSCHLC